MAVDELERRLREKRESDLWEAAATDPEFRGEVDDIQAVYASAEREMWPR